MITFSKTVGNYKIYKIITLKAFLAFTNEDSINSTTLVVASKILFDSILSHVNDIQQ